MKLHADRPTALNTVTAYGEGFIEINARRHEHPVLVMPQGDVRQWSVTSMESLDSAAFEAMLALRPEMVLLGTGPRQIFFHPRLAAALTGAHIGVEPMDTRAACRTYNILMAEGRQVLAALLPI